MVALQVDEGRRGYILKAKPVMTFFAFRISDVTLNCADNDTAKQTTITAL
jgi:hypothetical protein